MSLLMPQIFEFLGSPKIRNSNYFGNKTLNKICYSNETIHLLQIKAFEFDMFFPTK